MILYTEEDETKYCFYLTKSLEEFNKTTEQNFKYENDAIRYAIEYMIEEQQWTTFEMCTDCDDMTTCEHNVCSLYLTQFLSEFGYQLETYVDFEELEEY